MAEAAKQMRFSEEELATIKSVFGGNDNLIKLLRKVFLPDYDPTAPLGQTIDLWMTLDVRQMDMQTAYTRIIARNELIGHVEQQLIQLQFLAEMDKKDDAVLAANAKKDSSK